MKKPTMLYASPFPPTTSGISEYSSVLVKELSKEYDITLYIDNDQINDRTLRGFKTLRHGINAIEYSDYDFLIYNIGNQPFFHGYIYEMALSHPGYIILHDFSLYYMFIGYHQGKKNLYSAIYNYEGIECFKEIIEYKKSHGIHDILRCDYLAAQYTMNKEILTSGSKIIVHSAYAKNKILALRCVNEEDILQIGMIHQIEKGTKVIPKADLYKKYQIPIEKKIIASFGLINETKLNRETANAVLRYSENNSKDICYVMVGKGDDEGDYIDNLLKKDTIIKTGFTTIEEFNSFIEYADIIVNLRNPTRGETSASMMRILEKGKPCITNNGGWFSEIPDDCVYKIRLEQAEEELYNGIIVLLQNEDRKKKISEAAKRYANEIGSPDKIVNDIKGFLL